jgi:LmbE family N-acetylglucosaminyl deacetylase
MRVLVVAAHPDDEVLGCGGAIAHYSQQGQTVGVVICCRRRIGLDLVDDATNRLYEQAARRAAEILGYGRLWFFGFPDERLPQYAWELLKQIERIAGEFFPDLVLAHAASDYNQDHRAVSEACRIAFRPWNDTQQPWRGSRSGLLSFFVPSGSSPSFSPNYYLELNRREAQAKLDAWEKAYAMEHRDPPHPRSDTNLRLLLKSTGEMVGLDYAEAFHVEYLKEKRL